MTTLPASPPHRHNRLIAALAGALCVSALAMPPLPAQAQAPAEQGVTPTAPADTHGPRGRHGHRGADDAARDARREAYQSLTTPEERTALREKMRAAAPEERRALAQAHRAEIEQRARDRGIALPPATTPGAHGSRGRPGHHAERDAAREARREAYQSLTTPEERTALREKMRAAAPEERRALAQAHRAEIEQRARDRGIALPPAPSGHRHPDRGHGPRGPRAAPSATPAG